MAAPALARQKVGDALAATVGQSAPQVRAAHILLPTREEAEAARARVTEGGEDFAAVARELSTDESTAANGGELGWFTREEMVAPFAEAAFALEPGAISEPVETEFGWHVIQVEERDPDRPLTDPPDQSSAAGGRRALARGAACRADRDLDAAADADPVRRPTSCLPSGRRRCLRRHHFRSRRPRWQHRVGSLSPARRPGSTPAGGGIDHAILKSG